MVQWSMCVQNSKCLSVRERELPNNKRTCEMKENIKYSRQTARKVRLSCWSPVTSSVAKKYRGGGGQNYERSLFA